MIEDNREKRLRNRIFWTALTIAFMTISSGFIVENGFNYSLLTYPGIKFGSYGFQLAQIPSREQLGNKKLVILLGNSVYQYNDIPKYMQGIADELNAPVAFMNMAQIASTIYDYLAQAAKIVNWHPDMVVICMNEGTFSFDPRFKTDSDQIVFDPEVLKNMPASFYFRYFNYNTAVECALSTPIPLKRIDPLIRYNFRLYHLLPEWFLKWLSYPNDVNSKMRGNIKAIQMTQLEKSTGEEKFIVLREVLDIFQEHRVPVLFIWQEARQSGDFGVEYETIKDIIQSRNNALFADLTSYWNKETFVDTIHPNQQEEPRYAVRHYLLISKALAFFEDKDRKKEQGP